MERKCLIVKEHHISYFAEGKSSMGVMFIHGDGQNHTIGKRLLALFPDSFVRLGIDRPGHGASDELPERTILSECDVVRKVIAAECLQETILIGQSSGAVIAVSAALAMPIKALILINPFFCNPQRIFWYLPVSFLESRYLASAQGKYDPFSPYHIYSKERTEAELRQAAFHSTPFKVLARNLSIYKTYDVVEQAAQIACPVIILVSTKGLISTKRHVLRSTKKMKNVRIEFIDGTHNAFFLELQKTADLLRRNFNFLGF